MSKIDRIENITDQLKGYVDEVRAIVQDLKKDHGFTTNEAIKIVDIGVRNMECEVHHHEVCAEEDALDSITDTLKDIGDSIGSISVSIGELTNYKNTNNR